MSAPAKARNVTDLGTVDAGSIILRGIPVALGTDVGGAFITDCARHTEGLLPDSEIKNKWGLTDKDWERLAKNTPLLQAVRAERERRISNGYAAREAAQQLFAKAPTVLGGILNDRLVPPRHRIEAAKELRQTATGGDTPANSNDKFTITINLGADEKLVFEGNKAPTPPTTQSSEIEEEWER